MLFDEWNNSQRSNVTSGPTGLQSGLRSHGHQGYDHQGYDSDEDMSQPTATAGLHRYQGINQTHTQIGGGAMMTSAIVSSPNDPSLQSMDQINGGPSLDDEKMFQLERLDWRPSKEQGAVVGLAVGSGLLFIATQNCNIIRWNVETDEFEEIVLSKRADDRIHKVFLDPTGNHGIISMENGQVYYMHTKWSKAHLLSKVKNVIIESIAWNTAFGTETSTKKILIGTNRGHIYETCIEEKDKYFKKVHDLIFDDLSVPSSTSSSSSSSTPSNDLTTTTPVSGLYMELFPSSADAGEAGQKWFVMAATPNRQFQFIGGPTFEALFAKYTGNIPNSFRDFPGDLSYSELRTFSKYQGRSKASVADSVAWMNGVGIFYGNLVFGSQDKGQDVLQDGKLLAYPNIIDPATGRPTPPVSLTLTEFHFILVMKNRLLAINQLSEEIVYEEVFNTSTFGEMRGLAMDARKDTVWLYSDKCVFAVDIIKEDRDVWKLYLQQGQYELALEYCDSDAQAERVNNAKADALFEQGLFEQAAKIYADTGRSFEEVALKFVHISAGLPVPIPTTLTGQTISPISTRITPVLQAEARTALKTYLLTKLDHHIEPTELTQQVMICTWLTEIFLDNINRLQEGTYESATSLLRKRLTTSKGFVPTTSPFPDMSPSSDDVGSNTFDPSESETEDLALLAEERAQARENEVREFRAFLKEYLDCLNAQTTFELISSHGRIHELLYFAETIGDFEWVLTYHLQQGNYFQALDILANHPNPTNIAEKFYKFCPTLMHYLPKQTVDMLCQLGKQLDPSKLIPALMRYGDARSNRDAGAGASRSQRRHRRRPITSDHKRSESDLDADDIESDEDDHSSADDADYDNENGEDGPNHAIRYLEHMIIKLRNRDPILHNYLISLYATQKDERPLEAFVESQRGKIIFDYKYALRICHENGKYRSCVSIYESMKLYEEAVRMALEIDLERAKSVVAHAQDEGLLDPTLSLDDHQQKRLWILIAKHVIAHEQDISKAMSILKECDVRLEEILPFFPDFVRIGDFKEEICKSLDQYNAKIEHLKSEMEEYTDSANLIRADITALRSRFGVVTANQKCDLCSQQVLTSQFLLFPCTHAFHMSCCIAEATKYLQAHPHRKAQVLADEEYKDANSSLSGSSTSSSSNPSSRGPLQPLIDQSAKDTRDQRSIENFAASECCLCGEMMIASVSTPFITLPEEDQEAKAWEI